MALVIAIDGPAGSGKSTVSRQVARELDLAYLDTGAMYRAAAWWAHHQEIDLENHAAVAEAVAAMPLTINLDPNDQRISCAGVDITEAIRTSELSAVVSRVAVNLDVRAELVRRQQEIIHAETEPGGFSSGRGIVAEGRDITTVVVPDASVRVLLTAAEEVRLARRALENRGVADAETLAATRDEVVRRDRDDSTVVDFMHAADGVTTIDSSQLSIEQVVAAVVELAEESEREQMLVDLLDDFELDEEDHEILTGRFEPNNEAEPAAGLPVLAVVGRPNVGKSTLVNRIVGKRVAVVQDTPGVTRDRVRYEANWAGRDFTIVDTGGWERGLAGIDKSVADQAEFAVLDSDAVLFVLDATVGVTATDEQFVQILRRSGKPVVLAANKVDSAAGEADAAALWSLGLGEPIAVSALHGRGTGDLLDAVMRELPATSSVAAAPPAGGPRRIALLGRPNVGKSSLLNKLAGQERVVVNPLAGTTRDPVDEVIELDGEPWIFVDTAGIRRRVYRTSGADYYASIRTQNALEKAELGLVLIDAAEALTEQDIRVMQQVVDAGRAMVIVANKWDMVDSDRRYELERELEAELSQIRWVERVNLSAKTGWHTNRLTRAMHTALDSWGKRIPTGKLNAFLGQVAAAHPHPVRGGKQPRVLFATQVGNQPPRFVLFATGFIEHGYRRFLERQLREEFGFDGTPIQISVRVRERRKDRKAHNGKKR
ncbi:MAG: bifunctional cytidylate kinase/GTPase Der [Arcanobacterium sp.]|nr:bifunctional cytidylate kinase/GTPase Der [Arcanobacterium sp.]